MVVEFSTNLSPIKKDSFTGVVGGHLGGRLAVGDSAVLALGFAASTLEQLKVGGRCALGHRML